MVAGEAGTAVPVVSGICCESMQEAVEHAQMAEEAGAKGLLVMPPHCWLRFGMQPRHVVHHFTAIAKAVGINLIVHIYLAWTKASYSSELLAELARIPGVTTMKIGTREMSKYDRDLAAVRAANPAITMLTCHDGYLLASMVQGLDGALVGFASFIPEIVVDLHQAVRDGGLKTAMMFAGRLRSNVTRPPVTPPSGAILERIRVAVPNANLAPVPDPVAVS